MLFIIKKISEISVALIEMTSISAKILDVFRNLRSDATPRAPRPEQHNTTNDVIEDNNYNNENVDTSNDQEEEEVIIIEPDDDCKKDKKPKNKKSFFSAGKKKNFSCPDKGKEHISPVANRVNTQATGNVINIVDSKNVTCGDKFVYYLGPTNGRNNMPTDIPNEEYIEKTNLITLLMEAKITPEHEYIDYISKNLGRNWHSFFRRLGYTKGRIETFEIDEARNGVSEARYKLLLDWVRNDDDGTLGLLATHLWEEGERHIVKELSVIYKKNKE
ncbi:uncharacterized protein LOC126380477 [Pectinophora gossypiella]|uniref:uncharacterized protein LOC126380477 n=1 Tax=Pectinophora gossypiella TaxID=13191 RepID=UPI00214E39A9|nr:uncharacterized protein LOC126380477 [Pectinophora gossypiella]